MYPTAFILKHGCVSLLFCLDMKHKQQPKNLDNKLTICFYAKFHLSSYNLLILFTKVLYLVDVSNFIMNTADQKCQQYVKSEARPGEHQYTLSLYSIVLYFALLLPFEMISGLYFWQLQTLTNVYQVHHSLCRYTNSSDIDIIVVYEW